MNDVFLRMRTSKDERELLNKLIKIFNKEKNQKVTITQLMKKGTQDFIERNNYLLGKTFDNTKVGDCKNNKSVTKCN